MVCNHPVWYYAGSVNFRGERCDNERSNGFHYNNYICVECGQRKKVYEYGTNCITDFERDNKVLKTYEQAEDPNSLYERLVRTYYQHLYDCDCTEAAEKLMDTFDEEVQRLTMGKK